MFDIGLSELIVIMIIALLVIGPKRLPEVARALGKGLAEFRRALDNVKDELNVGEINSDVHKMRDSLLYGKDSEEEKKAADPSSDQGAECKSEGTHSDQVSNKDTSCPEPKSNSTSAMTKNQENPSQTNG